MTKTQLNLGQKVGVQVVHRPIRCSKCGEPRTQHLRCENCGFEVSYTKEREKNESSK